MRNVATVARRFANLERSKPVPMARAETWVAWLTAGEVDHLWSVTEGRDDSVFDIEAEPYRARAAERRAQVPYSLWSKINRSMDYPVPFDETFDPVKEVRNHITTNWSDLKRRRPDVIDIISRVDLDLAPRDHPGLINEARAGAWRSASGRRRVRQ